NSRTLGDVLPNIAAKLWPTGVADYFQTNAGRFTGSRSLQDALHCGFLKSGMADASALVFVHVTRLCADVGFVCFHFSAKLAAEESVLHCEANAMQHEPSGLLSYANRAMKLIRANAVFRVGDKPESGKALTQSDRTIFHLALVFLGRAAGNDRAGV